MFFDQLIFMLPAIIISLLATIYTRSTFTRYSRHRASSGYTGADAARALLREKGVYDVRVEEVGGFLSDHYDPRSRVLRLSPGVYSSDSLAAIGVACHEAGHAIQHADGYKPLALRSALVPLAQIGSYASYFLLPIGFMAGSLGLVKLGIVLFSGAVAFTLVTLPVEWNASLRAKRLMLSSGIVDAGERGMAGRVLNAAFLTYVAAAFTALLQLLYFLMRAGLLGGRRDD